MPAPLSVSNPVSLAPSWSPGERQTRAQRRLLLHSGEAATGAGAAGLWPFLRRWALVTGAQMLAGQCPCCGRAGCATGLGAATALGGIGASLSVAWQRVWWRLASLRRQPDAPVCISRELETLYPKT